MLFFDDIKVIRIFNLDNCNLNFLQISHVKKEYIMPTSIGCSSKLEILIVKGGF